MKTHSRQSRHGCAIFMRFDRSILNMSVHRAFRKNVKIIQFQKKTRRSVFAADKIHNVLIMAKHQVADRALEVTTVSVVSTL